MSRTNPEAAALLQVFGLPDARESRKLGKPHTPGEFLSDLAVLVTRPWRLRDEREIRGRTRAAREIAQNQA